jgi:putative DNA-invertase from lambdoid prophage Rac
MKVALYARVSRADESQSPENQLMRLRTYAKDRDWEIFDEYIDTASGADDNRPQLEMMMTEARARRFGLVLCVKVDRLARSTTSLYRIVSELEARGIKFECTDQDISTNTPTGKLLLSVLAGVAEFERELIRDRTKAGLARAKAKGKRLGRPRKHLDIDKVLDMRDKGLSYRKIAEELGVTRPTLWKRLKNEGGNGSKETARLP